jgi:hypothetical protein
MPPNSFLSTLAALRPRRAKCIACQRVHGEPEVAAKSELGGDFWGKAVGPFFDVNGVCQLTGLKPERVHVRGTAGDLLQLQTRDGVPFFPTFGPGGELLPELAPDRPALAD